MATRTVLNRPPITYDSATQKDTNVLIQLAEYPAAFKLYTELWRCRTTISALVRHHLRCSRDETCEVLPPREWMRGTFNVCIPVVVSPGKKKVLLRCPMPYKFAEEKYPGTIDEKLGCEVSMYAWMQRMCPDIRIPLLYGFGFRSHQHFTHKDLRPFYIRLAHFVKRSVYGLFGRSEVSNYTPNPTADTIPTAYMLLEYIDSEKDQLLSKTWHEHREDSKRQETLYRGIARLMLSLARVPLPRIGAFQFHDDCTVTLSNRPLTCAMGALEIEGTPRNIHGMYSSTESFVSDMITMHDEYFLSNPNAVQHAKDCRSQMATKTLLRALSHNFVKKDLRDGPFRLQLTDFHPSNIFVDEDWNITCLIDLEWICSLPTEMLAPPHWLTGRHIDGLCREELDKYDRARQKFMLQFEEEEQKIVPGSGISHTMTEMWECKGVWFWICLDSLNAMLSVFDDHVRPTFSTYCLYEGEEEMLSKFWRADSEGIVQRKVAHQEQYDEELRREFSKGGNVQA